MRIGLGRTLPTLDGFAAITALTGNNLSIAARRTRDRAGQEDVVRTIGWPQCIQKAAQRARSAYLLVWTAAKRPRQAWIAGAQDYLDAHPNCACVCDGDSEGGPLPTLDLVPNRMLVRRDVLLTTGGLLPTYQSIGDGPEFAWRLWAMGYSVVRLPEGEELSARPADLSLYLVHRNWLWTLIRDCGEPGWSMALSRALLQMMAWAGERIEQNDVVHTITTPKPVASSDIRHVAHLQDRVGDLTAPFHQVPHEVGEGLAVFYDVMLLLPRAMAERRSVQRLRRRSDQEIETSLGRDPVQTIQCCFMSLREQALEESGEA